MRKIGELSGGNLNGLSRKLVTIAAAGVLLAGCTGSESNGEGAESSALYPKIICAPESPLPEKTGFPVLIGHTVGGRLSELLNNDDASWNRIVDNTNLEVKLQDREPVGVSAHVGYKDQANQELAQDKADKLAALASERLQLPLVEEPATYQAAQEDGGTIYVFSFSAAGEGLPPPPPPVFDPQTACDV